MNHLIIFDKIEFFDYFLSFMKKVNMKILVKITVLKSAIKKNKNLKILQPIIDNYKKMQFYEI